MRIVAYIYSDPLLETIPSEDIWGLEIDRVYRDIGDRQQLQQLMADCRLAKPDYLLIRRLTELGDDSASIGDRLSYWETLGIEVIATEEEYTSHSWQKMNSIKLKLNSIRLSQQIQASKRRRRLKQGHARSRLQILPPPGKAPYGYRRGQDKYIIDKSTAPVVKDFFERFLLFGSLRGAVRYLEKRYGKKISPSTGRNWLTNPVYRGSLKYRDNEIISHTHAPIINAEEAAQIDRLVRRNRRLPSRTASAPRSLAGLVSCQQCQHSLNITRVTQRQKNTEYLYLRCASCPQQPKCKAIAYDRVLTKTIEGICLQLPAAVAQLNLPDKSALERNLTQEIERKRAVLQQLPSLLEQGVLDKETLALRNYKLRSEISQVERQIAQLPPDNLKAIASTVSIQQFWLDLSEAERRFYFREFIKQIEILRHDDRAWDLELKFIF